MRPRWSTGRALTRGWLTRVWLPLLGAWALSCAPAAPSPSPPAPAKDACAAQRDRVGALIQQGRIGRALRVIAAADKRCPESAAASAKDKRTLKDALAAGRQTALERVQSGLKALAEGDHKAAQEQFDQALAAERQATHATERVVLFARKAPSKVGRFSGIEGELIPYDERDIAIVDLQQPSKIGHLLATAQVTAVAGGSLRIDGERTLLLTHLDREPAVLEPLSRAAFSEDGAHVIGVREQQLLVLAASSGKRVAEYALPNDFQLSRFHDIEIMGAHALVYGYRPNAVLSALWFAFPRLGAPLEMAGQQVVINQPAQWAAAFDASSSAMTRARIYDLRHGTLDKEISCRPPLDSPSGNQAKISPDGKWLVSLVAERELELIDLEHGSRRAIALPQRSPSVDPDQQGMGAISALAFSGDGRFLCADHERGLLLLELATRRWLGGGWRCQISHGLARVMDIPFSPGHQLDGDTRSSSGPYAFSADGNSAVAIERRQGSRDNLRWLLIFEPLAQRVRHRIKLPTELPNTWLHMQQGVVELGFSTRYDLQTGLPVPRSSAAAEASPIDLEKLWPNPTEGWQARSAAGTVLWHHQDGAFHAWRLPRADTKVMGRAACAVAVSANGRFVAATPACGSPGELQIWDMSNGRVHASTAVAQAANTLAISNGGDIVALASALRLDLITLPGNARATATLSFEAEDVAFSEDARLLAIRSGRDLSLRSVSTPTEVRWATGFGLSMSQLKFFAGDSRVGVLDALIDTSSGQWDREPAGLRVRGAGSDSLLAFVNGNGQPIRSGDGVAQLTLSDATTHQHPASWSIAPGNLLLIDGVGSHTPAGTIAIHALPSGERRALLVPLPGGAVAFLPSGYIDWLGSPAVPASLLCQVGTRAWPFRVCEERWQQRGALAAALRGDVNYTAP